MSLVKLKGPIEKEDPNAVRKKLSPKALEQIVKRASEDSGKGNVITEFGDKTVEEDQHSITCNGNNFTSSTQLMKPVKINENKVKTPWSQRPKRPELFPKHAQEHRYSPLDGMLVHSRVILRQ